ncbi:hydrolase [Actinacidiphila acididurans]|uniref:hydrolase n=1 Tax=Actinacidiphila acididurans TaxID=2784346 RepID=UPI001F2B4ACB|nr:hydrolase [Actinacidiphila acididurans]
METILARLPADFWTVPYVASRFPGAATVADRPGPAAGGNCQLFAYEVLSHFGLTPASWRSSELWDDTDSTVHVPAFEPLDLLLFNASDTPYGAHVGVWAGDDAVLHLCAELGRPAVWRLADFAARERYRVLLGAKRLITPSALDGEASLQPFSRPGRGAPSRKAR